MSYNISRLCELFKCVCDNTTDVIGEIQGYRKIKILGGAGTMIQMSNERQTLTMKVPENGGKTLKITNEGVDSIDFFIDELFKEEEIKTYVSRSGIEKQIEKVLQENFGQLKVDDLESFVKTTIIKPIRSNIRTWVVYIPIVNLNIEKDLQLGDVVFVSKETISNEVCPFLEKRHLLFGGETEEEIQGNRNAFLGRVQKAINDSQAFAKVTCKSHSSNTEAIATNKAFVAINCIRAFTHILYSISQRALWGLPQEITDNRLSTTISLDYNEEYQFHINYSKHGAVLPFILNSNNVEKLRNKCCLEKIQEILAKSCKERICLENILIDSLQALGKGVVAPTTDMRFIEYIMCIERLLIRDGEETTKEKFADRLALALTDNAEKRLKLVARANEIYNKRSRMVHAASFFDIFEEDEFTAENWAINLVIMALDKSKKGYTHNQFCDEINKKKYT